MSVKYSDLFPLCAPDLPGITNPLLLQHLQHAGRDFCRQTEAWIERLTMPLVNAADAYDDAYDTAITAGKTISAATLLGDVAHDDALEYTLAPNYDAEIIRPDNVWDTGDDDDAPLDVSKYDFDPGTFKLTLNYVPTAPTAAAWVTATAYTTGTKVTTAGHIYECGIAHTSGTFATDLAAGDWTLYPDELIVKAILLPRLLTVELAAWFMERWAEAIVAKAKVDLMVMQNKSWSSPERVAYFKDEYIRFKNMARRDRWVQDKSAGVVFATRPWVP